MKLARKCFLTACLLCLYSLEADVSLNTLIEFDKKSCIELLTNSNENDLWNAFLEGQTQLFFDDEVKWIAQQSGWEEAQNVIEIGSGNGAYLSRLHQQFPNKSFKGIELLAQRVDYANKELARTNLHFQEGDAEILDSSLIGTADIILFRATLQHIKNPINALENAAQYLTWGGSVLIIESYDKAKKTSHPISTINNALQAVLDIGKEKGMTNRAVSIEILQNLEKGNTSLNNCFEIFSTNLDSHGNVLKEVVRIEGPASSTHFFNHALLFLALLHHTYQIAIDFDKAYEEVTNYINDPQAWSSPGIHFLVLKKNSDH